jgi:phenylalanine-4-hydroxylase
MLTQSTPSYSTTDYHTWSVLFERQVKAVQQFAYPHFWKGVQELGFTADTIPDFDDINQRLAKLTGWSIYPVPGLIDNLLFFEQLYEKKFGTTNWLRKPEQLDYLEEPDMFHDVFGHIPLLTDPFICSYLHVLAGIVIRNSDNEDIIEAIARLYWYTIEFGLVRDKSELKIYGAGILSSIAETKYSLSDEPAHVPFNVAKIVDTPYIKDSFQKQYFVVDSLQELEDAEEGLEAYLLEKFKKIEN